MKILGVGVQGFAKGPDGGCDAKFIGTAQHYPSDKNQWSGTMIIQAKHTNRFYSSCSDKNFYSEKSSYTVIGEEIPRIKNYALPSSLITICCLPIGGYQRRHTQKSLNIFPSNVKFRLSRFPSVD